jgi:phage tail sheath gpL-like
MTLSFDSIPVDIRTPGQFVEIDSSRAQQTLGAKPQRVLVIGQRLATGTVPALTAVRTTSPDLAVQQHGRGSMLAAMCAAFLLNHPTAEVWSMPVADDAAGVAATKTVTITGPATSAGTATLYVAGQRVRAVVSSGDTATAVATALVAAVNALPDLPVTAASVAGVVTLTARHKGEAGVGIDVRMNYRGETMPAGLAFAVAAGVAGTGNPDVADVLTAIGDEWFDVFVCPWTDDANLDALDAALADRWSALQMIEGVAFAYADGSQGALAAIGDGRNGPHLSIGGMKGSPTPSWVIASAYAAQVSASAAIDPARPFQTLALKGVLAPAVADRFTREERDLLLRDGISTFTIDAGGQVLIERPISTYRTNPFGLPDTAYLDLNTHFTVAYLRWSVRSRIASKYGRHKLADDGAVFGPGQAIVTPKVIKGELVALFLDWAAVGLVEDVEAFKAALIVERDATDPNRMNVLIPPDLVNQFRVFAAAIQFRL